MTQQGNPYPCPHVVHAVDRRCPRSPAYIKESVKARTVAVMYVNDDFGKGGRDVIVPGVRQAGRQGRRRHLHRPEPGRHVRPRCSKAKQANADALFVYLHEEESARLLRELRKQGYDKPIVGETTLVNEKVLELSGDAANGVIAHVGLTADAPNPVDASRS